MSSDSAPDATEGVAQFSKPGGGARTCRLQLLIEGDVYVLKIIPVPNHSEAYVHYSLHKRPYDGESYTVSVPFDAPATCTCADHHYRREQADPEGCKHVRALRAHRLLELSWRGDGPVPTRDPDPEPEQPREDPRPEESSPPPPRIAIDEDVAKVLRVSEFRGNAMKIPPISSGLYARVKKAVESLGGKRDHVRDCHVFPGRIAEDVVSDALATREIKDRWKLFDTPDIVIYQLFELVGLDVPPPDVGFEGMRILEPSAGAGEILRKIDAAMRPPRFPRPNLISAVEIDPENEEYLVNQFEICTNNVRIFRGDFLAMKPEEIGGPFHKIVMHPPFYTDDATHVYVEHVLHAFTMLAPGGRLAAVTPINWTLADNPNYWRRGVPDKVRQFYEFVREYGSHKPIKPNDAFKAMGTEIPTTAVILEA